MKPPDRSILPLDPDPESLRRLIDACADWVVGHLGSLSEQPSWDLEGAAAVADSFRQAAPEQGRPLGELIERFDRAVAKSFNTAGPGYLAFIPGGGIPSAALADFLACAANRYVGVSIAAPALVRIEQTAIEWLAAMMGYPATAGGLLTTGGSLANLMALVTARTDRLPEDFLRGTLYFSEETHVSLSKAARFAGFPEGRIRRIAVDERLRMIPERLEEAVRSDRKRDLQPFLVIPNVGTTNTGAIDPLPEILDIAGRHDLWVHADAAYGGCFRLVPEAADRMPGLERCDSITIDPHKGLFLPYGTGCLLVRDPALLRAAHGGGAHYLQDVTGGDGPVSFHELSPELSRDFRGLRVWLPLMLHGVRAFREQLRQKLELAHRAWEELREDPHLEMLDEPQLSVVAFAWRGDRHAANRLGPELLRRVNARRRVFLSSTKIDGRYVLRICVLSFRTGPDNLRDAIDAIREEAHTLGVGS